MKQYFLRHGTKDLPNSSLLAKHPYVRQFFQRGSKEFDSILEHQNNHNLCISIGTNMSSIPHSIAFKCCMVPSELLTKLKCARKYYFLRPLTSTVHVHPTQPLLPSKRCLKRVRQLYISTIHVQS